MCEKIYMLYLSENVGLLYETWAGMDYCIVPLRVCEIAQINVATMCYFLDYIIPLMPILLHLVLITQQPR